MADYDVVILNIASLGQDDDLRERASDAELPTLKQFGNLWFSANAEIVVIGDPSQRVCEEDAFFWSPVQLGHSSEAGEQIEVRSQDWHWYFTSMPLFASCFTRQYSMRVDPEFYLADIGVPGNEIGVTLVPIAETRYHKPIAVTITLTAMVRGGMHAKPMPVHTSAPAHWLPYVIDQPSSDVVNSVLRHRYGYDVRLAAPAWSAPFVLPAHAAAIADLDDARERLSEAKRMMETAVQREEREARFQGLLYEGDEALEPLVREAIAALGGDVAPPSRNGTEDGRITAPDGNAYMLEIKGLTGPVKVAHLRQLGDWVNAGIADDEWSSRGLLVANTHRATPPQERPDPVPGRIPKTAERLDQAILTTGQLFQALSGYSTGTLTQEEFWAAIAAAKGRVNLPDVCLPKSD